MDHFPAAALPFLTRLDISGLKLRSYPHHFGSIAKIAPSLTHLHLPAEMAMNIIHHLPTPQKIKICRQDCIECS